jgi:putative aldouronate transport system substrate-binding protein
VIRQDLLDELGLETPSNLDELHDVLLAFKTTYDLDDPLYMGNSIFDAAGFLMGAYDVVGDLYQVDGQVKYGPLEDGFKTYLETMMTWYNEGILNADFFSYDDNPMSSVTEGKKVNGDIGVFSAPASNLSAYCSDAAYYVGMPIMTDANGENHLTSATKVVDTAKGMTITTGCENVELAVQWCDFWYSPEGQLLSNYGIEGNTFEYDDNGTPHWTDVLTNNADGMSLGIARQVYTTLTQQPGVCPKEIEISLLDDNALAAVELWGSCADNAYEMPNVTLTSEESSRASQLLSDINTVNEETWYKILFGQKSIDDWDAYLESLHTMGIDEVIDIYQAALDRYNER